MTKLHGPMGGRRTGRSAWVGGTLLVIFVVANCGGRSARVESDGRGDAGETAVGGTGGTVQDLRCDEPLDPGSCNGFQPSFWFDATTGVCMPFAYGGCEGNANRFPTAEECYARCGGRGVEDLPYCSVSADCQAVRIAEECCSTELRDFVGIHIGTELPPCSELATGCHGCAAGCIPTYSFDEGYIGARCVDGHCVAFDYRPVARACNEHNDCILRYGTECCTDCRPEQHPTKLVALSRYYDLQPYACGPGLACQDTCTYDRRDYFPWCGEGTCQVMILLD